MGGGDSSPKVAVVVPVKNGGSLLDRVLRAVLGQETPWPVEVLVIDSGSRDGSAERAADLGVDVHRIPPQDFGHGKTRNLGARLTQGEFIVFITQDALPADQHWLVRLIAAAELQPDTAGAFGRHLPYPDCNPLLVQELAMHFAGFGSEPNVVQMDDAERYRQDVGYRQFLHYFSSNNACIRRSVWEQIPLPDVDFAEDQLWAQQAIEAGFAKAYAPDACVYHSHNFGVIDGYRRAFDEASAFRRLFGYRQVPNLRHLFGHWRRTVWRDWYALAQDVGPWWQRLVWGLRIPALALARYSGYYVGANQDRLPEWLVVSSSRDKALQRS